MVRWVGSLPGIDEPVAGIEIVCVDYLTFTNIKFLEWVLFNMVTGSSVIGFTPTKLLLIFTKNP